MTTYDPTILRLLDANLNRAVEGIRVLEECARMLLNDAALTGRIKELRHHTAAVIRDNKTLDQALLFARDTAGDVLSTGASASELKRDDLISILRANAKRAAEAVRALEEYGKLISPDIAVSYKYIRFTVYAIEQEVVAAATRALLVAPDRIRLGVTIDCAADDRHISKYLDVITDSGAGLIVLLAGGLADREFRSRIERILDATDRDTATILVDGRADLARISGADGVVLTTTSIAPREARAITGPEHVIGCLVADDTGIDGGCSGTPSPDIDLEIFVMGREALQQVPVNLLKPRIVTGVLNIESLRSLPSNMFDGILLTSTESTTEWCAQVQDVLAGWQRRNAEFTRTVPPDRAERKRG